VVEGDVMLKLRSVSKTFGSQRVLNRLDLDIHPGEVHGLVGQNGSGKSTLVKVLAGYHEPDPGGTATLDGTPLRLGSASRGIRFVHQDLSLVEAMSVSDNFRIDGGERHLRPLKRSLERRGAQEAMAELGYDISPVALVSSLSPAEQAAVAVARALHHSEGVHLVVLDEVTASLPGPEVDRLCTALKRIVAQGKSVLFISHHIDEVLSFADRITVLRDGNVVCTAPASELSYGSLVEKMLGYEMSGTTAVVERPRATKSRLVVRNMSGKTVRDLSFEVSESEILGISGLTGSGREEVAGLLAGSVERAGDVEVDGRLVKSGDPSSAIRLGVGYIPSNRHRDALLHQTSIRENLTLADLRPFWKKRLFRHDLERLEAMHWIKELGIVPPDSERMIEELSGGNQQKVVLARWLRVDAAVYVLDEPTNGVDVGVKADIHRLLLAAAQRGASIILCSTDAEELERLSSRVLIMQKGRPGVILQKDEISAERIEQLNLASEWGPTSVPGSRTPLTAAS
jgi:ribose transport system ATP-binding protein